MQLNEVKSNLGKTVLYDTGQLSLSGTSICPFEFSGCILRIKHGKFYYQAELKEIDKNSVIIVPLEKVVVNKNKNYVAK